MGDQTQDQSSYHQPALALFRPPWADPTFMLATSWQRVGYKTLNNVTDTLLVPADPRRWAIGFGASSSFGAAWTVYASQIGKDYPFSAPSGSDLNWKYLLRDGLIVTDAWYGPFGSLTTIVTVEMLIGPVEQTNV